MTNRCSVQRCQGIIDGAGDTYIISSTSIERTVTGRNTALKQIEELIHKLDAISTLTSSIGGKTARDWAIVAVGSWKMLKQQ
jgi:hypothetical protein